MTTQVKSKKSGMILWSLLFVAVIAGFIYVPPKLKEMGVIGKAVQPAVTGTVAELPKLDNTPVAPVAQAAPAAIAAKAVAVTQTPRAVAPLNQGPEVRMEVMQWNSQMGLMLANDGPETMPNSLMAQYGVGNLHLITQPDCSIMKNDLVNFAQALKEGKDPGNAPQFVAVMGDGGAAFLQDVNTRIDNLKLGVDYHAEISMSCGYSRGEDKLDGLPEWLDDIQKMRGALIAGYILDGDWNIAVKLAWDNGIPNNPDITTYDPNAINWLSTPDFLEAANAWITDPNPRHGVCETRPVVNNGKRTGKTQEVCVTGVVTWTPGDVNIAQQKGGLVSIMSTKENASQMPNAVIGIKKWNVDHRDIVESMIAATAVGGDLVKTSDAALTRAAEVSALVYNQYDAAYWKRYYLGTVETDKQGLRVELGGSYANNYQDMLQVFGLAPYKTSTMKATYKVFGAIAVANYPNEVPTFPPADEVINGSYTAGAKRLFKDLAVAEARPSEPVFEKATPAAAAPIVREVSRKTYDIQFETGSAKITPKGYETINGILDSLVVSDAVYVDLHGHTDSTGDANRNMDLSERRAFAVQEYLQTQAPDKFPEGRIHVYPHGQTEPVASNSTPEGKAKNRRVVIVTGGKNTIKQQ